MTTWEGQAPRGFARRWIVQGAAAGSWPCTTVFDLTEDGNRVVVRPVIGDRFTVDIDADSVRMLLETIDNQGACAVPCYNARHGAWLLGLRPSERFSVELYIHLPDEEIHVVYRPGHISILRDTLATILHRMT